MTKKETIDFMMGMIASLVIFEILFLVAGYVGY